MLALYAFTYILPVWVRWGLDEHVASHEQILYDHEVKQTRK